MELLTKKKNIMQNPLLSSIQSIKNTKYIKINRNINKEYFKNPHCSRKLPKIRSNFIKDKKISEKNQLSYSILISSMFVKN